MRSIMAQHLRLPASLWGEGGRTGKKGRKSLLFLKKKKQKDFYFSAASLAASLVAVGYDGSTRRVGSCHGATLQKYP
jgi:hypothetical protein